MKITQRQLLIIWGVFKASLNIDNSMGGISQKSRLQCANEILDQQDDDESVDMALPKPKSKPEPKPEPEKDRIGSSKSL